MKLSTRRLAATVAALILTAWMAAACNFPSAQPTPDLFATAAAETVAAELTRAAQASPDPTATDTPLPPTATPEATATESGPSPTPGNAGCTDQAAFVDDVTVPDDTRMQPGQSFTKTWRLRNAGTCTWTNEYDLVFQSGQAMSGPAAVALPGSVPPNGTVDLSVNLTAPNTNGTHRGNWMLRNDENVLFGIGASADSPFWVQIIVGPTPTPTQPSPSVYKQGKLDVAQTSTVDLDEIALSPSSSERDLWFEAVSSVEKYLTPQNGSLILRWTTGVPNYNDCSTASLSSSKISLDDVSAGSWICFKTAQGRFGRFEIENITAGPSQTMSIDIRTWSQP